MQRTSVRFTFQLQSSTVSNRLNEKQPVEIAECLSVGDVSYADEPFYRGDEEFSLFVSSTESTEDDPVVCYDDSDDRTCFVESKALILELKNYLQQRQSGALGGTAIVPGSSVSAPSEEDATVSELRPALRKTGTLRLPRRYVRFDSPEINPREDTEAERNRREVARSFLNELQLRTIERREENYEYRSSLNNSEVEVEDSAPKCSEISNMVSQTDPSFSGSRCFTQKMAAGTGDPPPIVPAAAAAPAEALVEAAAEIAVPDVAATEEEAEEIAVPDVAATEEEAEEIAVPDVAVTEEEAEEIAVPDVAATEEETEEIAVPDVAATEEEAEETATPGLEATEVLTTADMLAVATFSRCDDACDQEVNAFMSNAVFPPGYVSESDSSESEDRHFNGIPSSPPAKPSSPVNDKSDDDVVLVTPEPVEIITVSDNSNCAEQGNTERPRPVGGDDSNETVILDSEMNGGSRTDVTAASECLDFKNAIDGPVNSHVDSPSSSQGKSPAHSHIDSPVGSNGGSLAGSRAASPADSRVDSPTGSHGNSPTDSRNSSATGSRASSRAGSRNSSPPGSRNSSPASSRHSSATGSRASSSAGSRGNSPTFSRSDSPNGSRVSSPARSQVASGSKVGSPAGPRSASPTDAHVNSPQVYYVADSDEEAEIAANFQVNRPTFSEIVYAADPHVDDLTHSHMDGLREIAATLELPCPRSPASCNGLDYERLFAIIKAVGSFDDGSQSYLARLPIDDSPASPDMEESADEVDGRPPKKRARFRSQNQN